MSDPFLAEIRIFAGNFAPLGWAMCSGQLLPISQNTALFSLLGVTYGGDGKTNFALPNLAGSAPMQQGQGPGLSQRFLGQSGGEQAVVLSSGEMAMHNHVPNAYAGSGDQNTPVGNAWGQVRFGRGAANLYSTAAPNVTMSQQAIDFNGNSFPHNNMPPYLCLTFIIALQGIFPQRP